MRIVRCACSWRVRTSLGPQGTLPAGAGVGAALWPQDAMTRAKAIAVTSLTRPLGARSAPSRSGALGGPAGEPLRRHGTECAYRDDDRTIEHALRRAEAKSEGVAQRDRQQRGGQRVGWPVGDLR